MTAETYAQALFRAISETKPEDHDTVIDNLARVMIQNGDVGLLDQVEEIFHNTQLKASGKKIVEVTTAQENPDIIRQLNDQIGKDTEIRHKVDQGIIGGVIVKIDDTLIDGSIKNSIDELRKTMKG